MPQSFHHLSVRSGFIHYTDKFIFYHSAGHLSIELELYELSEALSCVSRVKV